MLRNLTPKGPYVPGVTKPVLVSVARPQTIFRFFETFCEDASQNKLCMSTNFMILGTTIQKLWVFEIFGQGLARVGMCWSQRARVDHLQKVESRRRKKFKKNGQTSLVQVTAQGQPATSGRPSAAGR
jgi:hypothetical protein